MANIANGIIGNIPGLARLVIIGCLIFNPITMWVVGGFLWQRDYNAKGVDSVYATNYKDLCFFYARQSTWERWTTYEGWQHGRCEQYLDRM